MPLKQWVMGVRLSIGNSMNYAAVWGEFGGNIISTEVTKEATYIPYQNVSPSTNKKVNKVSFQYGNEGWDVVRPLSTTCILCIRY